MQPYKIPIVVKIIPFVGNTTNSTMGFTLIEMLIVLTIAGILAAIAAPSLNTFLHSNRLATAANDFIADLNLARSEALKRGVKAIVCKSGGGSTCVATSAWTSGWIVFADIDDNGSWSAGDLLMRSHEPLAAGTTITAPDNMVVYDRQGQIPTTGIGDYVFCNSAIKKARVVKLNKIGRHTLSEDPC